MKKLRIALVGANGRMGQEISKLIFSSSKLVPAVAIVRSGSVPGFLQSVHSFQSVSGKDVDVVIDFSSPEMLRKTIAFCEKNRVPLVSGVTGIAAKDLKRLQQAGKKTAVLHAPNMSLGVAILKAALSLLSKLQGFDFQIIESHHKMKKDRPSGTAKALQAELESVTGRSWPEPLVLRVGGVIGEHEVVAASAEEIIRFKHEALNRSVFASGALRAAEYLYKKKKGMFKMEDVLQ